MRFAFGFLLAANLLGAPANVLGPSGSLIFRLQDHLEHPFIWWPRTLLEYPVQFTAAVAPDGLSLTDAQGAAVPFQLADVKQNGTLLRSATVCFFSDLPSGGHRAFTLKMAPAVHSAPGVTETAESGSIVLDAGVLKVRIPASQTNPADPPGPILQLSRGGKWIGKSRLFPGNAKVTRITATRLDSGPLFIRYKIAYDFAPSGSYTATVRVMAQTEFVELFEEMSGLSGMRIETNWSGLDPQFRQAPNHPYDPGHETADPSEAIDAAQMNTHTTVLPGIAASGELPFRLGIYEPWPAFTVGTFANFWNAQTGDALGVFIDKVEDWRDSTYSIWRSADQRDVRYFWHNGEFVWKWPLASGTRSTCLSFYDHALDRKAVSEMARMHAGIAGADGFRYTSALQPTSHMLFLQNRHGLLDLNRVKDWVLDYPESAKHPQPILGKGRIHTVAEFERAVMTSGLLAESAASGTRENGGFGPVPTRQISEWWLDGFNRFYPQMTPHQRQRLTAAFLLMAYTHAGDDYMPMVPMLSGHPNFLSDVKSVPPMMSFLFPEHPMAQPWADLFRKSIELNTHYHTRPEVKEWDAQGGRWTENLGTYVWAFLRPALRSNWTLQQFDGGNRFPTPEVAHLGDYLVDALSAPFDGETEQFVQSAQDGHYWGMVTKQNGPRRVHPPQGAHAARRMPPRSMWLLGNLLQRFAPITAEHLMWAARPGDQDMEPTTDDPWGVMYHLPDNRGTDPHLTSAKYTGYGIVLRAAVGTKDEISIHLQQIDEGPNYRWGNQPESGGGAIYFFAGGKAYSQNDLEDTGDRAAQDTDLQTNFGVWKDGKFRTIGRSDLDRPLYNLDVAQFAELSSSAYSAPEYVSRSVLLIGKDYFVTFDDVFNEGVAHRFSWFTGRWDDFPFIRLVRGGGRDPEQARTSLTTARTKGVWYDGAGDTMAIVSHRSDLQVEPQKYGAVVHLDGGEDRVFRDNDGVTYSSADVLFAGKAGVVRHRANGEMEIALIHGSRIGAAGLRISTPDRDLGISASYRTPAEVSGIYHAPRASRVRIEPLANPIYIDGVRQSVEGGEVTLPAGTHAWQITSAEAVPLAPHILRTANLAGGARILIEPVPAAISYRYEMSRDNGATWSPVDSVLRNLPDGLKVHVRATAVNGSRQSAPGPEYPVYISSQPPLPPDGLSVSLRDGAAILTWGEVLGASEYRLYAGDHLVYRGLDRTFRHAPAAAQYAVSAVDGNGEGAHANLIQASQGSWLTFDPKPGEPFRREPAKPVYYPR